MSSRYRDDRTAIAPPPLPARPSHGRARTGPERPPSGVTPFRFSRLDKVSRLEVELLSRVEGVLPSREAAAQAARAMQERLKALFEQEVSAQMETVQLAVPDALYKLIPEPSFLVQIALAPDAPRGLVEVELALAHAAIDQLLGGAAGEAVVLRALTEIEEGVLCYVILEGLKAIAPALEPSRPRLRLEGPIKGVGEAVRLLADEPAVVVLGFSFGLGQLASGYFRLLLPAGAVRRAGPLSDGPARRRRRAALFSRHAGRLGAVRSALRAEIGHCDLTSGELQSLRPGDVVLVEDLTARPDRGEGGTARLRVGRGQAGAWLAEVGYADGALQATLKALERGPPPSESDGEVQAPAGEPEGVSINCAGGQASPRKAGLAGLSASDLSTRFEAREPTAPEYRSPETGSKAAAFWDDEDEEKTAVNEHSPDEAAGDAAELLSDIPLHVAVELARVPITAEEVVALRAGQVLTLGKAPGDPVELSVNGKIVARGELVEVEGQLGVRVVSLSG